MLGTDSELRAWVDVTSSTDVARRVIDIGPELVVAKCGADGAVYRHGNTEEGSVGVRKLLGVNSVGADDSSNGRLLYGL